MKKKRLFDIVFSSAILLVAAVPMAVLAIATRVKIGSPVIFEQQRLGKDGVPFAIYKFRSMKDEFDRKGKPLADEKRITSFGKFMRSRGLDELPQLFNILKGDMSIVGPRPKSYPPLNECAKTVKEHPEILDVSPGLIGSCKAKEIAIKKKLPLEESVALDINDATTPWSITRDFNLMASAMPALSGGNPQEYERDKPQHNIDINITHHD